VFCECAKRILCYLSQSDSRALYQRSVDVIQTYAHHNKGRRSLEKEAEEEQFRDLLLLMEMLTNLLSKDFIDLAPQEQSSSGLEDNLTAADVCLYGLNIMMPLMTMELLKFPTLCFNYFRTITLISELHPEKICNLQPDLQRNLVVSLELGLTTSVGNDTVYQLCCDFVQVLCSYMFRAKKSADTTPLFEAMRPFLRLLMDLILSSKINSDLLPYASSTLYVLICCFQVEQT